MTVLFISSFLGNRGVLKTVEAAVINVREAEKDAAANPAHALEALEALRKEVVLLDDWDRHGPPSSFAGVFIAETS